VNYHSIAETPCHCYIKESVEERTFPPDTPDKSVAQPTPPELSLYFLEITPEATLETVDAGQ